MPTGLINSACPGSCVRTLYPRQTPSASLRLHHELRQPLTQKLHRDELQLSRYVNELIRRDLQREGLLSQEEQL